MTKASMSLAELAEKGPARKSGSCAAVCSGSASSSCATPVAPASSSPVPSRIKLPTASRRSASRSDNDRRVPSPCAMIINGGWAESVQNWPPPKTQAATHTARPPPLNSSCSGQNHREGEIIVDVAALAANIADGPPAANSSDTRAATSSDACAGKRS